MTRTITLPASPYECGRVLGAQWRGRLEARVRAATAKLGAEDDVAGRIESFRALLARFVPRWLEEVAGIAHASGVSEDDVLLLNAVPIPDDAPASRENCSSFLWVDEAFTALLKIRDERPHPQVLYAYRDGTGRLVQVAKDVGNIGIAHGINELGVAGGNNTGSRVDDVERDPRLNDCHMLRYLLENASSIDDIESLIRRAFAEGAVGGASAKRGSIFTAADRSGAVVAEVSGSKVAVRSVGRGRVAYTNHFQIPEACGWRTAEDGVNSRTRLARMAELVEALDPDDLVSGSRAIARDRANAPDSLCNDDATKSGMTVSAQLHVIPAAGRAVTYACCGNTRNSVFLPIPLGEEAYPVELVSGELFERAHALYRAYGSGDHLSSVQAELEGRDDFAAVVTELLEKPLYSGA